MSQDVTSLSIQPLLRRCGEPELGRSVLRAPFNTEVEHLAAGLSGPVAQQAGEPLASLGLELLERKEVDQTHHSVSRGGRQRLWQALRRIARKHAWRLPLRDLEREL